MAESEIFEYRVADRIRGNDGLMPYLEARLIHKDKSVMTSALVDSGASVNVLPFAVGNQLGLIWDEQTVMVKLTGNLAKTEARGIVLTVHVGNLPAKRLAFAWTRADDVPLLFGQVNFFMEFDVCFFRNRQQLQVSVKTNT